MSLTQNAHTLITAHFSNKPKRIGIDATCGNGHDTEFLCRLGFDQVTGFDVQAQAISASEQRIQEAGLKADFIHTGHENMQQHIQNEFDCVMFNFGYLPKADKQLTTQSETSLQAINTALNKLSATGLISLMCYPGHPAGAVETSNIKAHLQTLSRDWHVETHLAKSPKPTAPILFLVSRK